jgi:hypothetical protein
MALARQDLEVTQPSDIPRFYENPSRSFIYSDELRNHVFSSGRRSIGLWPPGIFKPRIAGIRIT